jgi:hypothetical protein
MRNILTDGFNSFWHVAFGFMTVWIWWIAPAFILYQILEKKDKNLLVDLTEFALGYALGYFAKKTSPVQIWTRIYS